MYVSEQKRLVELCCCFFCEALFFKKKREIKIADSLLFKRTQPNHSTGFIGLTLFTSIKLQLDTNAMFRSTLHKVHVRTICL